MKKTFWLLSAALLLFLSCAGGNVSAYKITNPILSGFYPDPSICQAGDDYYLVNSTFCYFPGIPVFHSKDLVNWTLIGHVMTRASQMDLTGLPLSRGIFAPAIRYHDGLFYVVCTLVDAGGNFVVTAADPAGPWSDPVFIPEINGIDPSLFFDDDGSVYIAYNSIPPDNKPLYGGHRTIRMVAFDKNELKVTGEEMILVNGGVDISKNPVWIEGPHIYKVNGLYYLMCAEGGTAEDHSEVIFRSDKVDGPYVPWEKNPILTQRHLDPKRPDPITCTGHADLVQAPDGNWWAVFLGCRPYPPVEENFYNTGRETFMAPVRWMDGWPVINPDFDEVQITYPAPSPVEKITDHSYSGNFSILDHFDGTALHPDWITLRAPFGDWLTLDSANGKLKLTLRPETCAEKVTPSFAARRLQHISGSAACALSFKAQGENEKAGLVIFQNERHFYYLCQSVKEGKPVVELWKSGIKISDASMELLASADLDLKESLNLRIRFNGGQIAFDYAVEKDAWIALKEDVDGTFLSTRTAGGFVGSMIALYATSLGQTSGNQAEYDWFAYQGNDGRTQQ